MRRLFFLPTEISYGVFGVMVYSFFKFQPLAIVAVFTFSIFILLVFRRSSVPYRDTQKMNGEMYLSPVYGVVQSIRHSVSCPEYPSPCHEVRISMSLWQEKGLYLPTSGEVLLLKASKGKKINRSSLTLEFSSFSEELSHTDFTLTSKNETLTLLRFIDCTVSVRPTIWLKSGDRGRGGACFGYYPFGGTLLIYVPATSDVLVFEKEEVVPGQTVIASITDQPKV